MIETLHGDCRERLADIPERSVQCVVTSPPYYGLRKYSDDPREIGQESTPAEYVAALVEVFRGVRRVLRDDGVVWLNLGDSYQSDGGKRTYGSSDGALGRGPGVERRPQGPGDKNLLGIPWRVAFALQDDGWYLRSDVIWAKPNCMPESVTDRPTRAHEYVFLLIKSARYFYDAAAVAEQAAETSQERAHLGKRPVSARHEAMQADGIHGKSDTLRVYDRPTRNRRTVWTIPTQPYAGAHYATMPEALIEPCILAGSSARACEHCGAPWVRVAAHVPGNTATKVDSTGWAPTTRPTDRFTPSCACPDNTGSAASVVLDPFAGSGTVGRVALRLQRRAVLIELNATYIAEHIDRRTNGAQVEMFV